MRLSNLLLKPIPWFPSLLEATIVLKERVDQTPEIVSEEKPKGGHIAWKRRKLNPSTIMHWWQEVWAYKFTWTQGDYDATNNLMGVLCKSCTIVSGRQKIMVPKGDNLEKHEGKRTYKVDDDPFLHLKKGETYVKRDYNYLKFTKLWLAWWLGGRVVDQLVVGFDNKANRKKVQFSTILQVLNFGRPMYNFECWQYLLRHLRVKNISRKHWSKTSG